MSLLKYIRVCNFNIFCMHILVYQLNTFLSRIYSEELTVYNCDKGKESSIYMRKLQKLTTSKFSKAKYWTVTCSTLIIRLCVQLSEIDVRNPATI